MSDTPRPDQVGLPFVERLLLRSRFGRRLLFLFIICALVPTCAVAFLSFKSVSEQLTEQSRERLAALASAAGKTLYDRLTFLENDLRKVVPRLAQCRDNGADSVSRDCGEGLLYAVEALARVSSDSISLLVGEYDRMASLDPRAIPALAPGQSLVTAQGASGAAAGVYLIHRPTDPAGSSVLYVARIDLSYLWSPADEEALPGSVDLSLWDPGLGLLVGSSSIADISPTIAKQIASTARGSVEWPGQAGASVATWWSLPETRRFRFPAWRVLLSEPQSDVLAPMAAFSRSFPLFLTFALLMVLVLGISQIRRSLIPLGELSRGTRRIADRDFETPVRVTSGDELQELAGAFNAMTLQLGRQFRALKTAAEIDRAVLSSVDSAAIVQTVLDRVPEIAPCEGISMTLLEAGSSSVGTTWTGLCAAGKQTKVASVLTPDDIKETRRQPEHLTYGREIPIPEFLAHFRRADEDVIVDAYPLCYGGELLGVLAVRCKPGVISEEETVQVRRLADQVAVALSNARMVDQVRFLAFYDSLTRLPNRVLYKERLAQALVRAERTHKLVAVCFLDLDHFSRINDTLGHDLGDVLLKEVAARLVACSRPGDSVSRIGGEESVAEVSRLGGDEFTVILPDISDPQDAVRVARRLLEAFRQPLRLGSQEVFVTTSVGVAIYPFDGADTEELLKCADVAMYHAKEQGRNTYQLYSASMNAEAMARMQLEGQLRKAVESGEFTIWYQPIIDLSTGKPTGAEALVRWAHPERGLVSPGEFITLCEECGLIVPLGEWILRTVCTQAKAWEDVGLGPLRMCVNLSARQLRHDGIVDTVRNILRETGLRPECLELELTESILMEPAGIVGRTIREVAELGVNLAIDDFGTGYSSLSYLKNFPVKTLKVDRSFIMNLSTDAGNAAITTAIIALAGAMGLEVVAEGVETASQADFLRERGCHRGQGYLFGKPLPVPAFENYLRGDRPIEAGDPALSVAVPA